MYKLYLHFLDFCKQADQIENLSIVFVIFINCQAFRQEISRFGILIAAVKKKKKTLPMRMNCFSILVKQYARRVHWIITSCRAGEWPFLENGTRSLDKKRKSTPKSSNGERDRRSVNARFREAYLSWRLVVKLLFLPATDFLFIRLRAMFSRNVAHDLLCKVPLIRISVLTHVQASWR